MGFGLSVAVGYTLQREPALRHVNRRLGMHRGSRRAMPDLLEGELSSYNKKSSIEMTPSPAGVATGAWRAPPSPERQKCPGLWGNSRFHSLVEGIQNLAKVAVVFVQGIGDGEARIREREAEVARADADLTEMVARRDELQNQRKELWRADAEAGNTRNALKNELEHCKRQMNGVGAGSRKLHAWKSGFEH